MPHIFLSIDPKEPQVIPAWQEVLRALEEALADFDRVSNAISLSANQIANIKQIISWLEAAKVNLSSLKTGAKKENEGERYRLSDLRGTSFHVRSDQCLEEYVSELINRFETVYEAVKLEYCSHGFFFRQLQNLGRDLNDLHKALNRIEEAISLYKAAHPDEMERYGFPLIEDASPISPVGDDTSSSVSMDSDSGTGSSSQAEVLSRLNSVIEVELSPSFVPYSPTAEQQALISQSYDSRSFWQSLTPPRNWTEALAGMSCSKDGFWAPLSPSERIVPPSEAWALKR